MGNSRVYVPLNDFITLQRGFDLPQNDRVSGVYPVVASTDIVGYHNEWKVEAPGVVIGRSGSIGGGQYIAENFWPLNTTLWVKDFKNHNPRYVYYLLKSIDFSSFNVGSGVPTLNRNHLSSILVRDLGKKSEDQIAQYLGQLDDKITLNRQINQTLEQMAQTLFKSWFVDFDPVIDNALDAGNAIPDTLQERAEQRHLLRAKADFKPLPAATLALFPSEFEETELGWVPKGWVVRKIKEFAVVIKGISYKSSELTESKTALVTLKSFNRGGGYRLDGLKEYSGKYKTEQIVKAGDLVVAYTDVTQAADIIGKPALVVDNPKYEKLVISLDVSVVRTNLDIYKTFFYNLMKTETFQNHTLSYTSGTTVLHLSKDAVPEYEFFCPNVELVEVFDNIVNKHYSSINININENIMLENIRNTLLPKLISGELALDDLPENVAEVAEVL